MEMFALEDELTRQERLLEQADGQARIAALVALAWHLRQRDTRRALLLADEAERSLADSAPCTPQGAMLARLLLLRGEAKWLFGGLAAAQVLAERALAEFEANGDAAGCSDVHWLLAGIARDVGDSALNDAELALAADMAVRAGDRQRIDIAEAEQARWAVLRDIRAAKARWEERFATTQEDAGPAARAAISDYAGLAAHQASDFGAAVMHWVGTYETALESGQVRRAITAATNIGDDFSNVGLHQEALAWMQRGLNLARMNGWPVSIGVCLDATAATLRHLRQFDQAYKLQRSALATMAPLAGSRNYAIALRNLGDLALDRNDNEGALDTFGLLQERAEALGYADFQTMARRGLAHALSRLNRPDEALQAATEALTLAREQGDAYRQVDACKVLAEIYARHALPPPEGMTAANAQLHYLLRARELASSIDSQSAPVDLLEAVASAHAAAGELRQAFTMMEQANAALRVERGRDAANGNIALKVIHESERARAEHEHQRLLGTIEVLDRQLDAAGDDAEAARLARAGLAALLAKSPGPVG